MTIVAIEPTTPNDRLRAFREERGLSQKRAAEAVVALAAENGVYLGLNDREWSRYERGRIRMPRPQVRWWIAQFFETTPSALGFTTASQTLVPTPTPSNQFRPVPLRADDDEISARVLADQNHWKLVRDGLNQQRVALSDIAAHAYRDIQRIPGTALLIRDDWMAPEPVDLADIQLRWEDVGKAPEPEVTGTEQVSAHVRPKLDEDRRYPRYSLAVRDISRPRLLDNKPSYRLRDVAWSDAGKGELAFTRTSYFEAMDVAEALGHEIAEAQLRFSHNGIRIRQRSSWKDLPFRNHLGDPFDLDRRVLLPSVDTITIRKSAHDASMILHHRKAELVASCGGVWHVMPCGVFQPSSLWAEQHDLDLWRNMLREYDEEFLGNPEADGNSPTPVDYDHTEPYRTLNQARAEGKLRTFCFGIGLDPLILWGEILTAVVIDDEVFDTVFADMVKQNAEGTVITSSHGTNRIAFNAENVTRLLTEKTFAPAGAGCLALSWQHRDLLLGR